MASALLKFSQLALVACLLLCAVQPLYAGETEVFEGFMSKYRAAVGISLDFSMKKRYSLSLSEVKLKGTLRYRHPGEACIELKGKGE